MAERWQEIAHELGSWDIEDTESPPWRDMVNQKGRSHVGDYVKTEPACKCIAALEAEVERLRDALEEQAPVEPTLREFLVEFREAARKGAQYENDHEDDFGCPWSRIFDWLDARLGEEGVMAERWQEIMDEFYEGKHGRCEDPLDFEVRASKRIAELEAEVERLRGLVETTCNEFAEEIKHTSHMDGLGMGDQRSESVVLALKYRLREALKENA